MNTLLSACWGCVSICIFSWVKSPTHKPQAEMICNGLMGGLVGITAGCASVRPMGASIIGLTSGVIVHVAIDWLEKVAKLDDVVGAIAVYDFCGVWGTLAVGIFMTPEALGDTNRLWQIGVQLIGIVSFFGWTFFTSHAVLVFTHNVWGLRVSQEDERLGLNVSEHGAKSTLLDLTAAMNHVTISKDYSENLKVDVHSGSEMGDLALGFNNLLDAVKDSMEKVKQQHQLARDAESAAKKALISGKYSVNPVQNHNILCLYAKKWVIYQYIV